MKKCSHTRLFISEYTLRCILYFQFLKQTDLLIKDLLTFQLIYRRRRLHILGMFFCYK